MKFGFENNIFYVDYLSPRRTIGNMREELDLAIKKISDTSGSNLYLGLSSGLDSQVVLHSLHQQGLPYTCVFFYMPGYNDFEYNNIKILEEKYKFKSHVLDLNPNLFKDELLEKSHELGVVPNTLLHQKFLSLLPNSADFVVGLEGPDLILTKDGTKKCIIDAWGSFENVKLRTLRSLARSGKVISLDKDEDSDAFFASVICDPIFKGFVSSFEYFLGNTLIEMDSKEKPSMIYYWNYYIKPIMLGRYWADELVYFPKYMGIENIDWMVDCPIKHDYQKNVTFVQYNTLLKFFQQLDQQKLRVYSKSSN